MAENKNKKKISDKIRDYADQAGTYGPPTSNRSALAKRQCPDCGRKIGVNAPHCPNCGKK